MYDQEFKISKWCNIYEHENIIALLHSLSLFIIYLPKKTGKFIVNTKKKNQPKKISIFEKFLGIDLLKILIEEKIVIPVGHNEDNDSFLLGEKLKKDQPLNIMYLLLTDGCNFKCRYCFEDAPNLKTKFISCKMNKETAFRAIEKFANLRKAYGNDQILTVINLYGGEPLLNKEIVYFSVKKIRAMIISEEFPKNTQVVLTTNGSLVTDKLAKFLAQNDVSVGLSIDGPIELNDKYRLSKNKKSAFELAHNGYKILKSNKVGVGISFTITPEVLNNQERVIDFLINDLDVKDGMGFNILHYNSEILPDKAYYIEVSKFILKVFEKFRKLGIYEDRIIRKVKCFSERSPLYADCGIIGNQIVVSPDGKIGICQDFIKPRDYFNGTVFDDNYDPVKEKLYNGWEYRSPLFTKECQNCDAIAICGGGCPASVEIETGNRWNIDERFCPHSRITLNWLVWDTYFNLK